MPNPSSHFGQRRVVMLYPGHSAEGEFAWLAARLDNVALPVHHTWEGPTRHDVASLLELGSRAHLAPAAAEAAMLHRPHAVMWACTSGSFVYGVEGMAEQTRWMADASACVASSTTLAFVEALRHLAVDEVAVAATYPAEVTRHLVDVLEASGVRVRRASSGEVPSGEAAGDLDERAVRAMIGTVLDDAGSTDGQNQAVLVPDTALHTVRFVDRLEQELGVTVLTANQVSAWWGLRLAGWRGSASGLGRLFRS